MTPAEWGLVFGIIAHSVAVIMALVKLVAWVASHVTATEQKLKALEYQVNNDVTGRRVVGEMKEDVATIKAQIVDIHHNISRLAKKGVSNGH